MIFFQRQKSSFPQNFVQYKISLKKDFTANYFLTKQFFVRKKRLSQNFFHQKTFLPKTCFIKKFKKKNVFLKHFSQQRLFHQFIFTHLFFIETKKRKKIRFSNFSQKNLFKKKLQLFSSSAKLCFTTKNLFCNNKSNCGKTLIVKKKIFRN